MKIFFEGWPQTVSVSSGITHTHMGEMTDGTGFMITFENGIVAAHVRTPTEHFTAQTEQALRQSTIAYHITWHKLSGLQIYVDGQLRVSKSDPVETFKSERRSEAIHGRFAIQDEEKHFAYLDNSDVVGLKTWKRWLDEDEVWNDFDLIGKSKSIISLTQQTQQ